jgi:hypothetical protein
MGSRTARAFKRVSAHTLCQLETCLAPWVPPGLFPKAGAGENSRDHHYTRWRTFWCMLWQGLNPGASGREVVRQLQALFDLEGGPTLSADDGAYCRARGRLPLGEFPKALAATARAVSELAPKPPVGLQGRTVKVVDGTALTLPDTPKNRAAYPPVQCPTLGFPMLRLVVLFALAGGAILHAAEGSLLTSELALLGGLTGQLTAGDILVGDRGFGSFSVVALLQSLGVDFIGRTNRRVDGRRRTRRLGKNDWLITWHKTGAPSPWLTPAQLAALPAQLTLRAVRGSLYQKGFRSRRVTVLTTLLDPQRYPAAEILQAYLRRWRLELCLDDLKTTLKLEMLRSQSPALARKEVYIRLIGHNLIRCLMARAASRHTVELDGLSFKGTLDAFRHFSHVLSRVRARRKRRDLWDKFLKTLAADLVPLRPGRREPRAVKRKKNKYPRLNAPRHRFRDHPKRHTRETTARLRKLSLM